MTQFTDAQLGLLLEPALDAFGDDEAGFWQVCEKQVETIRVEIADGAFRREVEDALTFLNQDEKVPALLWDLLLARPGHATLRGAVRTVHLPALAAVSEERFLLEQQIAAVLSGEQARMLRTSLDEIDTMMKAVTAYKSIHDGLHLLQPLLGLVRGAAGSRSRWPELRIYPLQFRMQLQAMDKAADDLTALNRSEQLGFRAQIAESIDALDAALTSANDDEVRDSASQISASIERALNIVDVLMLAAVEQAMKPVSLALQVLEPLSDTAGDTDFGKLINSYLAFAGQVASELRAAIAEHGRWQLLDQQFGLLQRAVVESQPSGTGEIDTVWRLASKQLDALCSGTPPPQWAVAIVELLCVARAELVPPISPPVADQARDRISELIANGRRRFMQVDQALLDWLSASAKRQPELVSLLKGGQDG